MSPALLAALMLQALGLVVLRWRLGKGWLVRPMTLLMITAAAYTCLPELVLLAPSARIWDSYRTGISQQSISQAMLIASAGLLAMTIGYVMTRPEHAEFRRTGRRTLSRVLDWRFLVVLCAPLAVLTYEGRGYNAVTTEGSPTTSQSLAASFLIILVVLAAFAFLERYGTRWFILVLGLQSVVLAAAGQRMPLVAAGVMLVVLLARVGIRPSARQVITALLLSVIGILGITGYRAMAGRALFYEDSGLSARITAIGNGLNALVHTPAPGQVGPGLVAQAAIRLDGNAFAGGVWQAMRSGQPPLGWSQAGASMLLVVPSSVWQGKLAHPQALSPAQTALNDFGLWKTNYLPTLPGLYLGFLGPAGVCLFLALMGAGWGLAERWLLWEMTVARVIILASLIQAVFCYEAGFPAMLVAVRGGIMLGIVAKALEAVLGCCRPARVARAAAETGSERFPASLP